MLTEDMAIVWNPSLRYPDPAIEILHPSFLPYRIFSASVVS